MAQSNSNGAVSAAKYGELESIRGIAALLVVFFHLPKWNPVLDVGIINNSYLMVELFFVLSGFVIFNAYSEKIGSVRDLLRFQFLRFGRLYPVHLLFLFAFVFIECAKYIATRKYGLAGPNAEAFQINNLQAFFENLFLVSGLLPTERLTYNGPSWSICVEFYTYLVFALVTLYAGRFRTVWYVAIAIAALVLMGSGNTFGFDHISQCLAGFFLGCLTAMCVRHARFRIPGFVSLALIIAIAVFLQMKTSMAYDLVIYPLSALLIASLVLSSDSAAKTILNFPGLTRLGAISYSLYMSHAALEWVANQAVRLVLKPPEFIDGYGNSIPKLSQYQALTASGLVVVALVILSSLVYRFVENPSRETSRLLAKRWLS